MCRPCYRQFHKPSRYRRFWPHGRKSCARSSSAVSHSRGGAPTRSRDPRPALGKRGPDRAHQCKSLYGSLAAACTEAYAVINLPAALCGQPEVQAYSLRLQAAGRAAAGAGSAMLSTSGLGRRQKKLFRLARTKAEASCESERLHRLRRSSGPRSFGNEISFSTGLPRGAFSPVLADLRGRTAPAGLRRRPADALIFGGARLGRVAFMSSVAESVSEGPYTVNLATIMRRRTCPLTSLWLGHTVCHFSPTNAETFDSPPTTETAQKGYVVVGKPSTRTAPCVIGNIAAGQRGHRPNYLYRSRGRQFTCSSAWPTSRRLVPAGSHQQDGPRQAIDHEGAG